MALRESGMPNIALWEKYFDPNSIFEQFDLKNRNDPGADLFCGFGTFTIPLARLNQGTIYAVDINTDYVSHLERKIQENKQSNVKILISNISDPTFQLPEKVSYVLLFNILHCEKPDLIILNVLNNLTEDGIIFIIHWRSDIETPRGPPLSIRPKMKDIIGLMNIFDFIPIKEIPAISQFHYGISFSKRP